MSQYNRFMFFCQERGGGSLLDRLLRQRGDNSLGIHWGFGPGTLPTKEKVKYYPLYHPVAELLTDDPDSAEKFCAYCMYADCWWGNEGIEISPDPFWGAKNLFTYFLKKDDWLIFSLQRDGRNHVTSSLIGQYINDYNIEKREEIINKSIRIAIKHPEHLIKALSEFDKFETQCLHWKYKAIKHIENSKKFPNYRLLYFEDLVENPVGFLKKLLRTCGFTPDLDDTISFKNNTTSVHGQGHLHTPTEQTSRYEIWWDRHYEICKRVMGLELKELGYTGKGID